LEYLTADNFDIIINEIIFHYKPCIDFGNKERDDIDKILKIYVRVRFMESYMRISVKV